MRPGWLIHSILLTIITMKNINLFNRKGLIIELDGAPHGEYHRIQKDESRDKYIESLGFTVIRFENRVVFQDPEFLKNEIRKFIKKKDNQNE